MIDLQSKKESERSNPGGRRTRRLEVILQQELLASFERKGVVPEDVGDEPFEA